MLSCCSPLGCIQLDHSTPTADLYAGPLSQKPFSLSTEHLCHPSSSIYNALCASWPAHCLAATKMGTWVAGHSILRDPELSSTHLILLQGKAERARTLGPWWGLKHNGQTRTPVSPSADLFSVAYGGILLIASDNGGPAHPSMQGFRVEGMSM